MKPDVSVILVSYNTAELTRECLESVQRERGAVSVETIVVDNASRDESRAMIERDFKEVKLVRSAVNLGFGAANNEGMKLARGRYVVLLNTDAFLHAGALKAAVKFMDEHPRCGIAGAKLVGRDGEFQASARRFPSTLDDAIVYWGLAAKYPRSRFFGRFDRTWADENEAVKADWVPGAFCIVRREALEEVGEFDPAFFLYYEEVDLCRRMREHGYEVWYRPEIGVTHLGGESSRSLTEHDFSEVGAQVTLWRMRSTLLYYRKHHGAQATLRKWMEMWTYRLAEIRNRMSTKAERRERARQFAQWRILMQQAWRETDGGHVSPARPW
jgi:GT2 family glycosyltransferase